MKGVTLWEPWASAIPFLLKGNETRGWATRYRGPLVIHAAKRWQPDQRVFLDLVREQDPRAANCFGRDHLFPLGCLVAVVWLEDCVPTGAMPTISRAERLWGNYGPGRYAWILRDVVPLRPPVPFAGKQGFFEVPAELLAGVGGIYTPWTRGADARAVAEAQR